MVHEKPGNGVLGRWLLTHVSAVVLGALSYGAVAFLENFSTQQKQDVRLDELERRMAIVQDNQQKVLLYMQESKDFHESTLEWERQVMKELEEHDRRMNSYEKNHH